MVSTLTVCLNLYLVNCPKGQRDNVFVFFMKDGLIKVLFLYLEMRGHPDIYRVISHPDNNWA